MWHLHVGTPELLIALPQVVRKEEERLQSMYSSCALHLGVHIERDVCYQSGTAVSTNAKHSKWNTGCSPLERSQEFKRKLPPRNLKISLVLPG